MKAETRELLQRALANIARVTWSHGEDCEHRDCESDCEDGDDCTRHVCDCGVDEVEELKFAAKQVLAEEPAT